MANLFIRTYTFVDGTTAYGSQVEAEIGNIVTVLNSLNAATTTWGQVSIAHATAVPIIADCSSGTQHIADFKNNSVIKASISSAGLVTCVGLAAGSQKITGLANGTVSTDGAAFGQLLGFRVLQVVQSNGNPNNSVTSSTFTSTSSTVVITPTTATSTIIVFAGGTLSNSNPNAINARATISGTTTGNLGDSTLGLGGVLGTGTSALTNYLTMFAKDTPGTVAAQTYTVQIKNTNNSTGVSWGNTEEVRMLAIEIG